MIRDKRFLQTFADRDWGARRAREMIGLRIGDVAPPFALQTGDGQEIRLTDILNSRAMILVFIRGTW